MNGRPIGIFDSGLGGLTVFREIKRILPGEDIVYFGDTARVPYGTKSKETVIRFSEQDAGFLTGLKVKMIVVACNTSSSYSLPTLKKRCDVPLVGVVGPGAREAARVTKRKRVGVIGTRATISSGAYAREIKSIDPAIHVISRACPLFVPLAEEGWLKEDVTKKVAARYLAGLKKKRVDTVVLGCTHYPLLKTVIHRALGKDVRLIDSAAQTAQAVKDILDIKKIRNARKRRGKYRFYVSDEPALFKKVGSRFLGSRIAAVKRVGVGAQ